MMKLLKFGFRLFFIVLLFCSAGVLRAQNMDIDVLRNINLYRNKQLDGGFKMLTDSDYPLVAALPISQILAGVIWHNKQSVKNGLTSAAAIGLNTLVVFGIKNAVKRERPYETYTYIQPYERQSDWSFPSGHTSYAFCAATCVSMAYHKWYVAVPAYTWAASVGYSRMHMGVHYPTDVLAGALLGSASAWVTVKGSEWLQRRRVKTSVH